MQPNPEVPGYTASGLVKPGKKVAHEMTLDDIKETIDAYASDAKICQDLGFDGVEIHGAHGYLIDNFFGAKLIFVKIYMAVQLKNVLSLFLTLSKQLEKMLMMNL